MNIKILVVVYNSLLRESASLASLQKQNNTSNIVADIVIYDNSLVSMYDALFLSELSKKYRVNYKHTPENRTLREIYNQEIMKLQRESYILFLDDDTTLPPNYLQEVEKCINNNPVMDLFVPKIYVGDTLYSPHKSYFFHNKLLREVNSGIMGTKNFSAINSGMVVNGHYFIDTKFKYPDFVDFYGTDRVFFDKYTDYRQSFFIMDLAVNHDVSNHANNHNIEEYLRIQQKVNTFWLKYLKYLNKSLLFYKVYMILYALKISIKKRNLSFVKNAIILGVKNAW